MIITIITCASSSSTLRWPNLAEQKSVRQEFILIGELRNLRFILYFQHPMVFEIWETWVSFSCTSNGIWEQNLSFILYSFQWFWISTKFSRISWQEVLKSVERSKWLKLNWILEDWREHKMLADIERYHISWYWLRWNVGWYQFQLISDQNIHG